jgi:hypothetical protein
MASKFQIPIAFKSDPRGLKDAESAVSGFGKKLAGIGALVAGAFAIRGIANFAKEAVLGAERAQQFDNILKQVAQTTGVFGANVNAATSRMIKFADSHELVIGVEAELIKETQALLLSFKAVGASGDEVGGVFDRATKAAFDMAAVLKTDARGSAVQLGKALENPIKGVTALARAGTTFTDQQREQIKVLVESGNLLAAQELILSEVESQYGGAAEAAALGSQKIVLAFGQVQDALGMALAPAFQRFTAFFIEEIVPPLTRFFEEDFPVMISAFGEMVGSLSEGLAPIGAALKEAFEIPDGVGVLESLLNSIAKLPESVLFKQLVESLVLLVPSLLELIPPLTELVIELIPLLVSIIPAVIWLVNALAGAFGKDGLAGGIDQAIEGQWGWIQTVDNFKIAASIVKSAVEGLSKPWVALSTAINNAYSALMKFFGLSGGSAPAGVKLPTPPRAVGGPVSARDSFLVGERGPEIFTPGVGGFITPNNRLGGGGGGGANITINVTAGMGANGAALGREIVSAIRKYERTSGPVFASA